MELLETLIPLSNCPPKYLHTGLLYGTYMGSHAYGTNNSESDIDYYGVCLPPRGIVFPHEIGVLFDWDKNFEKFNQFQGTANYDSQEWDLCIYNLVAYVRLLLDCNPNMIDSMFTDEKHCIVDEVFRELKDKRDIFLSKACYHRFVGYAESQKGKILSKKSTNPKRMALVEKYGFDTKFAGHLVRLTLECKEILTDKWLTPSKNSEFLKEVREGKHTLDEIMVWFEEEKKLLEELYKTSDLRYSVDSSEIKTMLLSAIDKGYEKFGYRNEFLGYQSEKD